MKRSKVTAASVAAATLVSGVAPEVAAEAPNVADSPEAAVEETAPMPEVCGTMALAVVGSYRSLAAARKQALQMLAKLPAVLGDELNYYYSEDTEVRLNKHGRLEYVTPEGVVIDYSARELSTSGTYVSIEDSKQIRGLKPGYFVVVVASGYEDEVAPVVSKVKDAGIPVYVAHSPQTWCGCPE